MRAVRSAAAAVALIVTLLLAGPGAHAQDERVLDDFDDAAAWSVVATDDVKASLRAVPGTHGQALCMDFDFGRVTGFVALRRRLAIDFPLRYELAFDVRGDAPPNALQLKFGDASGDNVWWMQRPEFRPDARWQRQRVRQREVTFAWGPANDRTLRHAETVEFVVASGSGAGRGSVCFDRLALRELPPLTAVAPEPVVRASSSQAGHAPPPRMAGPVDAVFRADGAGVPDWQPANGDASPTLTVDYGAAQEMSALLLHWRPGAAAARYVVELSDDGEAWREAQRVECAGRTMAAADAALRAPSRRNACPALQPVWLDETEARFLRLRFDPPQIAGANAVFALRGVELRHEPNPNAFFATLAHRAPRGWYPRAYRGEQAYWTVFGVEGARVASLLSEDGAVEPLPGVGALEPLLLADGRAIAWSDARIEHSLRDDELPMPRVHWRAGDLALDVEAFGDGRPGAARALARYRVRNLGTRARDVTLALAWRPFQANPPTQFLKYPGGASPLRALEWDGRALRIDGAARLRPLSAPDAVRLAPLSAGPVPEWAGKWMGAESGERSGTPAAASPVRNAKPPHARDAAAPRAPDLAAPQRMTDPGGFASGVLAYRLRLRPGESRAVMVALPVEGEAASPVEGDAGAPAAGEAARPPAPSAEDFARRERRAEHRWRERLSGVRLSGNAEVREIAHTLRAALGHILVNRSGPALQPGARAYARSWIRDGALTSEALLRLGRDDVARDFLRWYAPFQFGNGKVPCCATERGADPVPENDSDGEFAHAAAELWRYTRDDATARALWPHVRAAVAHMETLRQSQRGEPGRGPGRAATFGLMPPSISHEGYSDKPAWSYWDDHWTLIGYRGAAELAHALGEERDAARIAAQRDEFRTDLLASIAATARLRNMDTLAGAADRGDFDPTSSTIALAPGGLQGTMHDAFLETLLRNTFDAYWREFEKRRADDRAGIRHGDGAYTPYEWRNVGAFVRLGERERALAALRYFFADRRPAGWRQWAEVVLRDAREPRFLGDMPHGWVASDHIRAVLDLFAYEHEGERSLVLAAGVPMDWLRGPGVSIENLRTPYGELGWRARAAGSAVEFEVRGLREMPPGGLWLRGPWPAGAAVWLDGERVDGPADRIRLPRTPLRVRIETGAAAAAGR